MTDKRFMALALSLGRRGQGRTWPNPAVGCVIVQGGRIVGRGWTQPGGRPHGEVEALTQAGVAAKGSTVYVTLEPCAHHGKTPPCAQALIDAQVARVVLACTDPDERVSGRGIKMLQDAGVTVVTGISRAEAEFDHMGFLHRTTLGRPMLTLKLASSFDGRIATETGESQWITAPEARRYVHALRSSHDAVMVGGGTARKDDPSLTVRDLGTPHQPTRVVVSRGLDLPLMGQLARTATQIPLILCHGPNLDPTLARTWRDLGATLLPCAARGSALDASDVMHQLANHGLTRVFCEGGGALAASLIKEDLVDQLIGFTAGVVIGAEGLAGIGPMTLPTLNQAPRFTLKSTRQIGPDVLHTWVKNRSSFI